jgi:hypothetical protein
MNEILTTPRHQRWPRKGFFKRLLWNAARRVALGGLYAWGIEEHWLKVERRAMPIPGLGDALCGSTLAHISDLHCSPIVLEKYLNHCVDAVNRLGPDFIAVTGDLITGPKPYARRVARILARLSPRIATVACLGNHDYGIFHPNGLGAARDLAQYVAEQLSRADIFVMMNESRVFRCDGAAIQFVGLEDLWSDRYDPIRAFETAADLPTIALCHNPDAAWQVAYWGAHWVLAGHTHGSPKTGTRLRDLLLPASHKDFLAGLYALGGGKYLYVNRGLGYARRMNLNARPEITLFTLNRAEAQG